MGGLSGKGEMDAKDQFIMSSRSKMDEIGRGTM